MDEILGCFGIPVGRGLGHRKASEQARITTRLHESPSTPNYTSADNSSSAIDAAIPAKGYRAAASTMADWRLLSIFWPAGDTSSCLGTVLAEQVGIPVPSVPALLAMGAVAGLGYGSIWISLLLATVAALIGDAIWYDLGRRKGHKILNLLCRISLEPDSCVSTTKQRWDRFGGYTLLFSKFVPGIEHRSPASGRPVEDDFPTLSRDRRCWGSCFGLALTWPPATCSGTSSKPVVDKVGTMGRSLAMLVFGPSDDLCWLEVLQPPAVHPRTAGRPGDSRRAASP